MRSHTAETAIAGYLNRRRSVRKTDALPTELRRNPDLTAAKSKRERGHSVELPSLRLRPSGCPAGRLCRCAPFQEETQTCSTLELSPEKGQESGTRTHSHALRRRRNSSHHCRSDLDGKRSREESRTRLLNRPIMNKVGRAGVEPTHLQRSRLIPKYPEFSLSRGLILKKHPSMDLNHDSRCSRISGHSSVSRRLRLAGPVKAPWCGR